MGYDVLCKICCSPFLYADETITDMQKDRGKDSLNFDEIFTLSEKFLNGKKLEGLRDRTIEDYETNFIYLKNFIYRFSQNQHAVNEDFLKDYVYYMSFEMNYSPFTCNFRLRTIKAYLNWLYAEGYLNSNLSLKVKLLKTPEDKVQPMPMLLCLRLRKSEAWIMEPGPFLFF